MKQLASEAGVGIGAYDAGESPILPDVDNSLATTT